MQLGKCFFLNDAVACLCNDIFSQQKTFACKPPLQDSTRIFDLPKNKIK